MKPAIEVHHVTKEYRLGAMQSLRQLAITAGSRLLGRAAARPAPFKALDDVSFTIQPGEVVGVIGHNGAGKSTLLKILSHITKPTSGHVKVNGRVAPLIEVGAGFVGEMTGRENVYLNGAILGMSRKEIARKFDAIVDFAEMEQFIDTPVKRYSSGMQVKLAFAVATSIESEILIMDEVLAVGDLAFQRKCFDLMEELIKRQGRTVLLVSHNIRQVERFCGRGLLLEHGLVSLDGPSKVVCDLFFARSQEQIQLRSAKLATTTGGGHLSDAIRNVQISLSDAFGVEASSVRQGESLAVTLTLEALRPLRKAVFAVGIHTPDLLYLAVDRSDSGLPSIDLPAGRHAVTCVIRNPPLLPGIYAIRASIVSGEIPTEDFYGENLKIFSIFARPGFPSGDMRGEGFISLDTIWDSKDRVFRQPIESLAS